MSKVDKISVFKEILFHLNEWYKELNPTKENDLSILKVMKLLFFVSGVNQENNLFGIFDKFQAWQYGHVEADIYNYYSENKGIFGEFNLDRFTLKINSSYTSKSNSEFQKIQDDINELKKINLELISYDAFRLVDISHSYSSWDIYYNKLHKRYENINKDILTYEPKYYR